MAAAAAAQPPEPLRGFAVDVRGAIPFYPNDAAITTPRETTPDLVPRYGIGLDVGAHVYPFSWKVMTFGFGASYHLSRGSRTPEVPEGSTQTPGPTVQARLQALSPQASLNFGHRMGWSYLSAGLGTATFREWREDLAEDTGESTQTLNYGGGARWFTSEHIAVTVDLRFYRMKAVAPSDNVIGHPRMTRVVVSAGVAFR
jgi:hypothetical protein